MSNSLLPLPSLVKPITLLCHILNSISDLLGGYKEIVTNTINCGISFDSSHSHEGKHAEEYIFLKLYQIYLNK